MRRVLQFFIIFAVLATVAFVLQGFSAIELGNRNYWNQRGFFFLLFVSFFPRLTLLFSSVTSGGFLWWLSWLFAPRFLAAILATTAYWNQNPILVSLAWLIAIVCESSEKIIVRRSRRRWQPRPSREHEIIDVTPIRKDG